MDFDKIYNGEVGQVAEVLVFGASKRDFVTKLNQMFN